jgi:hypothetical protein
MAIPKKPKPSGKGTPPSSATETPVMGNNTTKPEKGKWADIPLKVAPEYKREVQDFARDHEMTVTAVLKEGFELLKKMKGKQ